MTNGADDGDLQTLRRAAVAALEQPSQRGAEMLQAYASVAAQAQVIDVSALFSYFWDETSEDEYINIGDFPNISLNPALAGALGGTVANVFFFEARAPNSGFASGMMADSSGNIGPYSVSEIMRAAVGAGLPVATTLSSDPMIVFCEDAMVEKIGAMVIADLNPSQNAESYRGHGMSEPEPLHQVLQIFPFIKHDSRMDGKLLLPQAIAELPVADTLRVRAESVRRLPFIALGMDGSPDTDLLAASIGSCVQPVLNSALFCLSACNAMRAGGKADSEGVTPKIRHAGSDGYGQCFTLTLGPLAEKLNEQGEGDKPEIGHALTMCRDYFY